MSRELLEESKKLIKDIKKFKKTNVDFLNDYNKYLDEIIIYRKFKEEHFLSHQEQFCGLYNV